MVATDTIVGIVGAVVLVAVMAGVFVYEYNNTEPAPEDPPRTFLEPNGDLDGDGVPNGDDPDVDGDDVPDREDDEIAVTRTGSGSVGRDLAPVSSGAFTLALPVEPGHLEARVVVTGTPAADTPQSDFVVQLLDPEGNVVATAEGDGGESYALAAQGLGAGEHTVRVSAADGSLGGEVEVTATVLYG